MTKLEKVASLRVIPGVHYNCCQSLLLTFAEECGIDEETALRLGANMGHGMSCGSVCGSILGCYMVLGLLGAPNIDSVRYMKGFREEIGTVDCADIRAARKGDANPRLYCDLLIDRAVAYVEQWLAQRQG